MFPHVFLGANSINAVRGMYYPRILVEAALNEQSKTKMTSISISRDLITDKLIIYVWQTTMDALYKIIMFNQLVLY